MMSSHRHGKKGKISLPLCYFYLEMSATAPTHPLSYSRHPPHPKYGVRQRRHGMDWTGVSAFSIISLLGGSGGGAFVLEGDTATK